MIFIYSNFIYTCLSQLYNNYTIIKIKCLLLHTSSFSLISKILYYINRKFTYYKISLLTQLNTINDLLNYIQSNLHIIFIFDSNRTFSITTSSISNIIYIISIINDIILINI